MLAVLIDAIEGYQDYISQKQVISETRYQQAEEWILDENRDWPFSSKISVKLWALIHSMSVEGFNGGRSENCHSGQNRSVCAAA